MPLTHAGELSSGQGRKTGVGTSEEEGGGSKGRLVSHGTEDLQSRVVWRLAQGRWQWNMLEKYPGQQTKHLRTGA